MSTIKSLFIFASGAAIGSIVTWKLLDAKYEQLIQDEIESVKEAFGRRSSVQLDAESTDEDARTKAEEAKEKPGIIEYASLLQKEGYVDYSEISKKEEPTEEVDKPYVIPPENFGELDEYTCIGLTYYADGVLTDDGDEIIDDVDDIVGSDSLKHFGEFEDDSVHVRNDRLKCDYEIIRVSDNYSDK